MEVLMRSARERSDTATEVSGATPVPPRLEVVVQLVADRNRATSFNRGLWLLQEIRERLTGRQWT
jgi:hypothetical protein